jgi:hypothetical protein
MELSVKKRKAIALGVAGLMVVMTITVLVLTL